MTSGLCTYRLNTDEIQYSDGRILDVVASRYVGFGYWERDNYTQKIYKHFNVVFSGSGGTDRCGVLHWFDEPSCPRNFSRRTTARYAGSAAPVPTLVGVPTPTR